MSTVLLHSSHSQVPYHVGYGVTANIAASHIRVPRQLGVRFPVPEVLREQLFF